MLIVLTSHPIQYQAPLWREMAKAGIDFEVWFLTPHAVQPTKDKEFGKTFAWDLNLLDGYRYRFLKIEDGWSLDSFWGIRVRDNWKQLFALHNVTHLWVEGWRFSVFWKAVFVAASAGVRIWMRAETNDLSTRNSLKTFVRRRILKLLFAKIHRFLCIGSANRRFYRSMGVRSEQIVDTPYCVDNDRFAAEAAERRPHRPNIRDRWNVPESAFCVLFCGKLIPKKRPLDLIAALQKLAPGSVHALIVGDGELLSDLKQSTNVVFDFENRENSPQHGAVAASLVGFLNQSEIVNAYVAADCLVLASDAGETWGLVVNEAMATGLTCVVSNKCGCSEDLPFPQHVFRMGDIETLASKLRALAEEEIPRSKCDDIMRRIEKFHPRKTAQSVMMQLRNDATQ
jgi:glycosyltransferase involved in cell wall biosynthesis